MIRNEVIGFYSAPIVGNRKTNWNTKLRKPTKDINVKELKCFDYILNKKEENHDDPISDRIGEQTWIPVVNE